ncbi:uncharacterized protein RAG0_12345 [Rhynchosporium agropyri]|uniref:Uncharacterized protein n=1 Tax=Rhynchosporium agropyri TaxID=914238 RepID=A0A1E1L804_9HELO|nr:uncharacterized protein RAG0_12345 [Rhynchosporium agropyri]
MKSKARAKVNEEIPRPETYLRYTSEYTLFLKLKCTLASNSITTLKVVISESSEEVLKITEVRFHIEKKRANYTSKKLVINSNTELSFSITIAITKASGYTLRSIAKVTTIINIINTTLLEEIRSLYIVASLDMQLEDIREEVVDKVVNTTT